MASDINVNPLMIGSRLMVGKACCVYVFLCRCSKMTDNDLIRIIITLIIYKLPSYGYNDVTVKQSQQPTLQGANTNPTIYFYKLFDRRYGWTKRESKWDPDELTMTNTESQMYETTFQMGGMVRQIPSNPYG